MEKTAYIIYLILLPLSILLFGAMHTYVYTILSLGVLLAALFLVIKSVRKDQRKGVYQLRIQKTGLHFFFLAILAFLVFQLMPLPPFLVAFLSPESGVVWQKSIPAQTLVGGETVAGCWHSLASYGYPVRMSIIRWVVYGLFFFGLVRVLNSQKRIQSLVYLLLLLGCFEAFYGLVQAYSGDAYVLWKNIGVNKSASGTYINRNHFAGFLEMGLLLAAAFSVAISERKNTQQAGRKRKNSWRSRFADLLSSDQRIQKRILILFSGVVMGVGLVFSASRGGIVAAAGGLLCISLFFVFRKDQRRKGIVFLVLFLFISAYSLDIGIDYVLGRFGTIESSYEERSSRNRKTMILSGEYKLSGVGIGNFQYAFPKFQDVKEGKKYVRFGHNDWVQFLAEAGIIGFALLLGGLTLYLYVIIRLWRQRSDPFSVGLGIAPVAAMAALAIHSFSDFNLHIPANFLLLVAIMAIGYAALHLERHHRRDRMNYRYYNLPLKYKGGVVLVLILGLIGWSGWWSIRHFVAEAYCNTVPNSTLNRDKNPPVEKIVKAIGWDPGNAGYWAKLAERKGQSTEGRELREEGKRVTPVEHPHVPSSGATPEELASHSTGQAGQAERGPGSTGQGGLEGEKLKALEKAVALNPFSAEYHLRLGWEYAHFWKEPDYHSKWLPAADISMDRAAYFAGVKNPHLHQELGNYWTMRSKSVLPNNSVHHEAWAKACWHYKKAQSIEAGDEGMVGGVDAKSRKRPESGELKRMKKEIRAYVWNSYPDEGYVKEVLSVRF